MGCPQNLNIPSRPSKADSPLIVNSNAVLPLVMAGQFLQTVSRRNPQILEGLGCIVLDP
jgi:hypothetical protein